ncbi:hypothetical protein ACFOLJ_19265 [Rugamonas sp. CCM 8940]|uniref:hypothetical protein n=1 Tax=Rugamonas sp. CCM 8940 TaxID=2765359 RepID=UPI0018F38BC3|nr:hypothetical protein [Rugamonas sp. CCM 8940]MBJ7312395.1 hypothetical protein [Rugamonas sp. CCM 8940]
MPMDRGRIVEGIVIAVIGGAVTAAIIAVVPGLTRWLVRPSTTPGQIAAFEGKCPDGWDTYSMAGGRFMVGAGTHENKDGNNQSLSKYQPLDVGGEEAHILTIPELPPHDHKYTYMDTVGGNCGVEGCHSHQELRTADTSKVGEGKPHNNRPPYLALQYCKAN